jgi:hypothetical protein
MTNINLNPVASMTIDEVEEKRKELVIQKHELTLKNSMGMSMTDAELLKFERIDGLIDQCDYIIDWMTISGEEEYDWSID